MRRFNGGASGLPLRNQKLHMTRFYGDWEFAQTDPMFEVRRNGTKIGDVQQLGMGFSEIDVPLPINDTTWVFDGTIGKDINVVTRTATNIARPQFALEGYYYLEVS